MRRDLLCVLAVVGGLGGVAGSAAAQFVDFGLWNRYVDWQSETETGPRGTVWEYGVVDAASGDAWYASDSVQPLTWSGGDDPAGGNWSHGNRAVFNRSGMTAGTDGAAPWVGWNNPAGDGTSVDIDGKVRIQTSARSPTGPDDTVEFVVAKRAKDGSFHELHRARINSAELRSMGESGMVIPVSLHDVTVNDGESIVLSSRVMGSSEEPATVQLIDDISIAIDPPVQTGKIMEAAFNRPFPGGGGGGISGGGGGGGSGSPSSTGEPPVPTEDILDDVPDSDDSSRMPTMIPTPSSIAVITTLGGLAALRRRR